MDQDPFDLVAAQQEARRAAILQAFDASAAAPQPNPQPTAAAPQPEPQPNPQPTAAEAAGGEPAVVTVSEQPQG